VTAPKQKRVLNARYLFIALLGLANAAYADGTYQHTKDGKTLIWNPDPKATDVATWSGSRDARRYATGDGTLTWYKIERKFGMGSRLPIEKEIFVIRYSGTMVRGKFEGVVVAVDAEGKSSHAPFNDGSKSSEWVAGPPPRTERPADKPPVHQETVAEVPTPVPSPKSEPRASKPESVVEQSSSLQAPTSLSLSEQAANQRIAKSTALALQVQAMSPEPTPIPEPRGNQRVSRQPPAEGPLAAASPSPAASRPAEQRASRRVSMNSGGVQAEDLLRSMVIPPSTIGAMMKIRSGASPQPSIPSTSSSPPALPRLSTAEVIGLADAEARKKGYDLGGYQCSKVDYTVADDTWSVMYEQKPAEGMAEPAKHFRITVADKTKKTSIVTEK
jgi:hypothetical protein